MGSAMTSHEEKGGVLRLTAAVRYSSGDSGVFSLLSLCSTSKKHDVQQGSVKIHTGPSSHFRPRRRRCLSRCRQSGSRAGGSSIQHPTVLTGGNCLGWLAQHHPPRNRES
jgi:hypothetical protein